MQFAGMPPLNTEPLISRWWLKSEDDAFVLQCQDNLIGFNWRRRSDRDTPPNYPGFETLKDKFDSYLSVFRTWCEGRGAAAPAPLAVELLYDDIIELKKDDATTSPKLSSILNFWAGDGQPLVGWNTGWLELISGVEPPAGGVMKFAALAGGLPDDRQADRLVSILRLNFTAMKICTDWNDVDAFLIEAHAHIRKRFKSMIAPKAMAAWE